MLSDKELDDLYIQHFKKDRAEHMHAYARAAIEAALRAQADARPVAHRFRQILDDGTPAAWNFCDGDYLHPSTSLDHSCWEVESLFIRPAPEAAQALSDEQVKAAQEVFEKWFCEDLGLDMDSDESERIITEMLKAAGAATVAEPVVDERAAFKVEGMTRAEFEAHLRACFQHDNVRAREQGRDAPISGLSADQEREIVERVELNYPTISHCPGCTAFDSDVAEVNFVQGCTGCTSRMQKIAGFGPLYRAAQSGQRAGDMQAEFETWSYRKILHSVSEAWEVWQVAYHAGQRAGVVEDAARWNTLLQFVGAWKRRPNWNYGFHVERVEPLEGANLFQGSVAEHFTQAIDAHRAAAPTPAAQGGDGE